MFVTFSLRCRST
ncbi:hypothetical protein YPPY64_3101, partial [Yersinia pestis PY-64]